MAAEMKVLRKKEVFANLPEEFHQACNRSEVVLNHKKNPSFWCHVPLSLVFIDEKTSVKWSELPGRWDGETAERLWICAFCAGAEKAQTDPVKILCHIISLDKKPSIDPLQLKTFERGLCCLEIVR